MTDELDQFEFDDLPDVEDVPFVPTQRDVAEFFNRSVRQIRRWTKEDGFPKKTRKGYDLAAIRAWILARFGADMSAFDRSDESYEQARRRKEIAGADKAEWDAKIQALRFDLLKSQWHSEDSVRQMFEGLVVSVREAFLLIPRKLAADLGGKQGAKVEKLAIGHVDGVLDLLASDEFMERLEEERRRLERAATTTRGRGRPKKKTRRANK